MGKIAEWLKRETPEAKAKVRQEDLLEELSDLEKRKTQIMHELHASGDGWKVALNGAMREYDAFSKRHPGLAEDLRRFSAKAEDEHPAYNVRPRGNA